MWAQLAASMIFGMALGGCSVLNVFEPARKATLHGDDELTTASIAPRPKVATEQTSPLSAQLDAEDWRRASAAMATALDPQGNGGVVKWDNPDSGAKGSFGPAGDAFLIGDDICRLFITEIAARDGAHWHQGTACRHSPGDWRIREHKPWKRPG
ncbi:MAG: RT0821/Lpp0805 family surface protein [Beijerinckiaceae bacterium]